MVMYSIGGGGVADSREKKFFEIEPHIAQAGLNLIM